MVAVDVEVQSGLQKDLKQPAASGPDAGADLFAFPASFAQQRLWFLDQLQPGNVSYNIVWSIRIAGDLNVEALIRALHEILRRHEVLRTTFSIVDGEVMQLVAPSATIPVPITDLSSDPQLEKSARQAAAVEGQKPLDLKCGPLVRARLLRLDARTHILLLTLHHIIFDAWSRGILARELAALYEAYAAGRTSPLPEPRLQFGDYAVWQREHVFGKKLGEQLEYWKRRLQGASTTIDLPTDRPRPITQSFAGTAQAIHFSANLTEQLRALARREQATLFMVLLAGCEVLLARYSGQNDFLIGTPIANRGRAEIEDLIGFFANTVVLRAELSDNPTFREVLERVKNDALGAFANQELPFEKLVEELRPARSLGQNPLFQVLFSLQNAPRRAFELSGLEVKLLDTDISTAKFDVSIFFVEGVDGLRGRLEYNTDLFDAATIRRMLGHYEVLLAGAVADPNARCSALSLFNAAERRQLLVEWNATQVDYPHERCLHQLFERQAQRTPHAVACQFNGEQLTYAQLNERANQLAHYLRKAGVGRETLVGFCVERSLELLVGLLGILKAGGAYVPVDPAYPGERIAFILNDARAPVLVTERALLGSLPQVAARTIVLDAERPQIDLESVDAPTTDVAADNLAYVLYTSGSTGKPKGVQIEHRSVVNLLTSMQQRPGLSSADTLLAITTLSFDIAGLELYLPLVTGAKVVLASREDAADGNRLLALLKQSQASVLQATPATWRMLLDGDWSGSSKLKALCGGEALPADLATQLRARCAQLWNLYGPTETTIWSSVFQVETELAGTVPIGRPIGNTNLNLLDANCQLVPIGVAGELYIGGHGVARGYLNRPELNAEKFLADPFRPGERLYRTGDRAKWLADGTLQFLGRSDHQVKVRGYRIELGEIETALAQHPALRQSVVVVRNDDPGGARLVAFLVLGEGKSVAPSELRAHLKLGLPDYMIPSSFVTLAALPLTPNGKIDRNALQGPDYARPEQIPGQEPSPGQIPGSPRDDFEHIVLRVWQRILRTDHIERSDSFFDVGGHSLLAVRMLNELKRVTGQEVALAELFRAATIEHLAGILRGDTAPVAHLTLTEIQPRGTAPPFFAVAAPGVNALGYLALSQVLGTDQPLYMLQGAGAEWLQRPYTELEIERLAADYVRSMRAAQAEGPYHIGGMCEGMRIAFEMARLLELQGQEVGLLATFDTWAVENSQVRALWYLHSYGQRLSLLWKVPLLGKAKAVAGLLRKTVMREDGTVTFNKAAWHAYYWPGKQFVPKKINTLITAFKLRRQPFYYVRDPLMGWGSRTTKGVVVHLIKAKHLQMLREPSVRNLGAALSKSLRRAQMSHSAKAAAPTPVSSGTIPSPTASLP